MQNQEITNVACESAKVVLPNKMIVFSPKLKPAAKTGFAKIHAGHNKEKTEKNMSIVSCIGLSILDYSKGKGENTVKVNYNLSPEMLYCLIKEVDLVIDSLDDLEQNRIISQNQQILEYKIQHLIQMMQTTASAAGVDFEKKDAKMNAARYKKMTSPACTVIQTNEKYTFLSEPKIVGSVKDENNKSPVTKLVISRCSEYNGGKSARPWFVSIEEGTAVAEKNAATGGTSMKKGSYTRTRSSFINLTDRELRTALYSTCRYLELWEMGYGIPLIKEGIKLQDQVRTAKYSSFNAGGNEPSV